jgi:hypothetical protein
LGLDAWEQHRERKYEQPAMANHDASREDAQPHPDTLTGGRGA